MVSTRSLRLGSLLLAGAGCVGSISTVNAEDWPNFRGENRDGISSSTNLMDQWPSSGPELLLTAEGAGRGYASPAIAGGKAYTLGDKVPGADDEGERMTCFDAKTGKLLWSTKTGPAWNSGKDSWQGSRSTPAVDGDMVYVITPHGRLVAAKTSNGDIVWSRDLKEDLGGKKKDSWGYSESPLIDGDKLICTPGGPKATVVALNKLTGETIWTCARADDPGAGHSCVVTSNVGGRKVYVQNTGGGPLGIDAETGKLLWDYDISPPTAFIPTPIIDGDLVYTVAGYGTGGALLKQVASGRGVDIEEVYGLQTDLGNKHGGVIKIGDHLYFGKEDRSIVTCARMDSGEVVWKERGQGKGSIAIGAADGKIFLRYQSGEVVMAKASPGGFEALGKLKTPTSGEGDKPSWAHPVIADGRMYLREDNTIYVYNLSK
ncbi:MAG: PQQ-like beta-propeller repeat protein [Aureliella sp.]